MTRQSLKNTAGLVAREFRRLKLNKKRKGMDQKPTPESQNNYIRAIYFCLAVTAISLVAIVVSKFLDSRDGLCLSSGVLITAITTLAILCPMEESEDE